MKHDEELERIIRKEIDDEFSYLDSNPSLHNVIMSKIEGERIVKRKVSMTLVFAIVMTIVIGSMAFAAGLGLFEHFSVIKSDQPAYSERLERLDQLAVTVGETIEIVTPEWTGETDTDYGKIAASQAGRKFTLTIDEAYCDGNKLFYTYTFSHDPNKSFSGEGKPTGFEAWDIEWPDVEWGTQSSWVNSQFNEKENTWFAEHPTGWFAAQNCYLGDGADLTDGTGLRIWDSWLERRDENTWQSYYEVELPEGYEAGESVEIILTAIYQASLNYVDETGIYWGVVNPMENANTGMIRVPVTIPVTGSTTPLTGEMQANGYSAKADLLLSEHDISGVVNVTPKEEWHMERDDELDDSKRGNYVRDYVLIADGVQIDDNWGGQGWLEEDGTYRIEVRYTLPESMESLRLRPVYRDRTMPEDEEIILK